LFLCFLAIISSVTAADFNNSSTSVDIQTFINNTSGSDNEIVLQAGDYVDNFLNLNITRSVTIKSNGQTNIISTNGGTLFNITAPHVTIINLNISGYATAIKSNTGDLLVAGSNISTSDISINITGSNLADIIIENNTIVSSLSNPNAGAIFISLTGSSIANVSIKNNDIVADATTNSFGVWFTGNNSNITLVIENNTINGTTAFRMFGLRNNNTITITNNEKIYGRDGFGILMTIYGDDTSINNNTITITNNNITAERQNQLNTAHGIMIDGFSTTNNKINISDNIIIAELIGASGGNNPRGISMSLGQSNNSITIDNNKITSEVYGIYLDSINCDNQLINLTNNNIETNFHTGNTGTTLRIFNSGNNIVNVTNNTINSSIEGSHGLVISAYNSTNIITLDINNISAGGGYGLQLYVYDSNNTINVTKNNITARGHSVELTEYNSNNTLLRFFDNNITSLGSNGMNIITWQQWPSISLNNFNGLELINNTINSTGPAGLYFNIATSSNLTDILITGNNIFGDYGIRFLNYAVLSSDNITIN